MNDKPQFLASRPQRKLIYMYEDDVESMQAENERLRATIKLAHCALTKSSLTADERVHDATGVLSRQLSNAT